MEIRLSEDAERIVQQLLAEGQYGSAEEAVNAMFLRAVPKAPASNAKINGQTNVETPYVKAMRAGLIGAATGLPSDLSQDGRHMEGFGRS